jgi:hypothetical protein
VPEERQSSRAPLLREAYDASAVAKELEEESKESEGHTAAETEH